MTTYSAPISISAYLAACNPLYSDWDSHVIRPTKPGDLSARIAPGMKPVVPGRTRDGDHSESHDEDELTDAPETKRKAGDEY